MLRAVALRKFKNRADITLFVCRKRYNSYDSVGFVPGGSIFGTLCTTQDETMSYVFSQLPRCRNCRAIAVGLNFIVAPLWLHTQLSVLPSWSHTLFLLRRQGCKLKFIVVPSRLCAKIHQCAVERILNFIAPLCAHLHCCTAALIFIF